MINKRGGQIVAPLCVFSPRLGLPIRADQFAAARGPPLIQGTVELPANKRAGPGGGAALAQLLANPDRMTLEGTQYERGYARGRPMQEPGQNLSRIGPEGAAAPSEWRGWWAVQFIDILLIISASLITWCWTAARSRSRAHAQALASRRERAELLARMTHMQDVAARARVHTAQVTKATAEWSAGYKQGCADMIRAMAALRAGAASQTEAEEAASAK